MIQIKGKHWNSLKKYSPILKLIVAICILALTFRILLGQEQEIQDLKNSLNNLKANNIKKLALLFVVFLMPVNWLLETKRWHFALKRVKSISFGKAFMGTICGASIGIIMPNRTGQFIGRIMFLPFGYRIKGIIASIFAGLAQLSITIIAGASALSIVSYLYFDFDFKYYLIGFNLLIILFFAFLFLKIDLFANLKAKNLKIKKFLKILKILKLYNKRDKLIITILSVLRYSVFLIQFAILIWVFSNSFNFKTILFAPLSFYFNTIIPSFTFGELGMREIINLQISNAYLNMNTTAVFAGLLLWIINVFIPSIFGVFFIFRAKLFPK